MRVIAGESRGRRLPARLPESVRPTSDRVREALFSILGSRGGVEGLRIGDLCCGSGAIGIEALSRGAKSVLFVDNAAASLAATATNLEATGFEAAVKEGRATLVRSDLLAWVGLRVPLDLVICDPPYAFSQWETFFSKIAADLVVCESNREIATPDAFELVRERRHGGTLITVFERHRQSDSVEEGTR